MRISPIAIAMLFISIIKPSFEEILMTFFDNCQKNTKKSRGSKK
jgi:hypothetical protein